MSYFNKGWGAFARWLKFLLAAAIKTIDLIATGFWRMLSSKNFLPLVGLVVAWLALAATVQQAETSDRMLILSRYDKLVDTDTSTRHTFKVGRSAYLEAIKGFEDVASIPDPELKKQKLATILLDTRGDLRTLLGCTDFLQELGPHGLFDFDSDRKASIRVALENLRAAVSVNPKLFPSTYQHSAASIAVCHGTGFSPTSILSVEPEELKMDGLLPIALRYGIYSSGWLDRLQSVFARFKHSESFDNGNYMAATAKLKGFRFKSTYRNAILLTGVDLFQGQEGRLDAVLAQYKDPTIQLYEMMWINAGVCASRFSQSCQITRNRTLQMVCSNPTVANDLITLLGSDSGTGKVTRFYTAFSAISTCNRLSMKQLPHDLNKFIFGPDRNTPFAN